MLLIAASSTENLKILNYSVKFCMKNVGFLDSRLSPPSADIYDFKESFFRISRLVTAQRIKMVACRKEIFSIALNKAGLMVREMREMAFIGTLKIIERRLEEC